YDERISKVLEMQIEKLNKNKDIDYKEVSLIVENILLLDRLEIFESLTPETKKKISGIIKTRSSIDNVLPNLFDTILLQIASGELTETDKKALVSKLFEFKVNDGGFSHKIDSGLSTI
ncbi:hypothetical protein OSK38_26530, partial [Escherichia coli]|nr:hypothetical protein [Escherichia coli]